MDKDIIEYCIKTISFINNDSNDYDYYKYFKIFIW